MRITQPSARRSTGSGERGRSRATALLAALGTAGLIAVPWFGLSVATGLVYHLVPGATFLASAWAYRLTGGSRPAPWRDVTVALAGAGGITAGGLLWIPGAGGAIAGPG